MAIGPGKYDEECTLARVASGAAGVVLIIIGGNKGNGFSAQLPPHLQHTLPSILRQVAAEIESS